MPAAKTCLLGLFLLNLPLTAANVADAFVGHPAPDFKLKDLDGHDVQLSALKGKIVLLDFWATWCGPCRVEIPLIEHISKQFGKKGVVVVGVNVQESGDIVRKFAEKNKMNYPIVLTADDPSVIGAYGARAYPTAVVIDKDGIIASYRVGVSPVTGDVLSDDIHHVSSASYVAPQPKKLSGQLAQNTTPATSAASQPALGPDPNWQPKTADEFTARGFTRLRLRKFPQAKGDAEEALRLRPDSSSAEFLHGRAAYEEKDYPTAIEDLDKVIQQRPDWPEGYRYRGLAYSYYGQHQRAVQDYQKAIQLNPYYGHVYNALGWAETELGQFNEARINLDKAIELEPDLIVARENRAKLFAKQNDLKAELNELSVICGLTPGNEWAKNTREAVLEKLGPAKQTQQAEVDPQ